MSYFDSLLGEESATRTAKKSGGTGSYFDSLLGDGGAQAEDVQEPEAQEFGFDVPSPTAPKRIGFQTTDAASQFSSALEAGDFSVTPEADPITGGYDRAPDKWKYKQTLSNTELAHLAQTRPESKGVGSVSEAEKERQRKANSAKLAPGSVQYVPDTAFEAPGKSYTEQEMRVEKSKGSISGTATAKVKNVLDDVFGESEQERVERSQMEAQNLIERSDREYARRATIGREFEEAARNPVDETTGGEFYKALKQGLIRDVPRSFFSSVEAITAGDWSMKTVNEWAAEQADEFLASRLLHPEENAPADMADFLDGGYADPRFWKRGAGQVLSTAIPTFAMALGVGLATKNPAVAARAGLGGIYAQESGQAYAALIDSGFAPSDAKNGALVYGAVATALENVNFGKTLSKILWPGKAQIAQGSFRKVLLETLKESGSDVLKEAATESAQQFAQNVMTKFYDRNQDLFEGVAESAALGWMGGVAFSTANNAADLARSYMNDPVLARDVVSGIKKVSDEAKAVAANALSRFQNAAKTRAVSAKSEVSSVTVDTVEYPDGKVSASVEVEPTPGNSVVLPFSEPVSSKEEAVAQAVESAKAIVESVPGADVSVIEQAQEQAKSPDAVVKQADARVTEPEAQISEPVETAPESQPDTVSKYEEAMAVYEDAGISRAIAEKNIGRVLMAASDGKGDILHPDNKNSRKVFELFTGMKLPKGVVATDNFLYENRDAIRSALQESNKEVKSSEPNKTTYADRQESVPDAGKQGSEPSGSGGAGTDSGRARGERDAGAPESGARPDDGGTGSARDELTNTPKPRFGKTARAKLNADVKAILEKNGYSTNAKDYSAEEIRMMKEYSGAGGKIDKGAEGRGVLDEFYTPREVVASMWDIVDKFVGKPLSEAKVLEPSAGVGRFIESAPNAKNVTAYELDKVSGTIVQILHPEAKVEVRDFQTLFIDKGGKALKPEAKYDVVIGNPPYGDRSGLFKGLGEESKVSRWEEYFVKRGMDLLNEDGLLVYIIPSSFLDGRNSKVKEYVESQGFLVDAYRMPEGTFEDTQVGTDIIAIRKGIPDLPGELSDGKWFEKNPRKVLGSYVLRKDRFGKEETAVTGSKEEAFAKLAELVGKNEEAPEPKSGAPKSGNKVEIFPITEWPLAGKVQAIVTEWPDRGKLHIAESEEAARSGLEDVVSGKAPEKAKESPKPRTVERAPKKAEKAVDVSGIQTLESQTLNAGNATVQELEIFAAQDADGSITQEQYEAHPDWAAYLNYEGGRYYHSINYYSGDIRRKLDALESDKKKIDPEQYDRQKSGLLAVLPPDKRIDEITFDPIDRFITKIETGSSKRVYRGWNSETVPMTVEDAFVDWIHSIDRKLIGYGVQKGDIENFVRGNRQRANTKNITVHIKSESRRLFNQFMRDGLDAETQKKIVDEFNRTKNSYVRPAYDRIPVVVKGMATEYHGQPFQLSPTQRNGVGFLVNKGSGLVAYGVGVGKTHTLLVATKANMDKGWTKRPLFVVPASTLETWIDTTKRMFPGMKVNNLAGLQSPVVARLKKSGSPSEWIKDGEISFITHEGILRLGFDENELFDLTSDLNDALGTFDYRLTTRQIEQAKEKAQEVLGQSLKGSTDVLMRDLGIDHVSVDEVHNFRKVFQGAKVEEDKDGNASQRRRFSNVTGGQPSARARKLFLISQYVQKNNGGRNVFLASATPFENHATEVYNVLSFMARERLKQMGIYNINDFYSTFANFQTETVQKTDGSWQEKEVMKSFSNLKQLQSLLQEFIDKKEEKTLVRPEKVVIAPQLKMSPLQAEVKQKIREMIATDDDGVLLKATTYMKANSFSPYFVPEFAPAPKDMYEFVKNSPKVEYAMEMLRMLKNDPATAGRSNFVYVGSEGIGFTDMYVDYLVKEVGFKREEIGVITWEVSDETREDIKKKFNSGEIKVLIGGTPTKEGINLQMNGYATFNLSLGWNPTEMAQVEGRVWRQGNNLNKTLIVYPLVENSGDIGIYQKFEEKASRINDLFSYEGDVFDVGEIDPKEKKLLLLTDPVEKANLAIKLEEAQLQSRKLYLDSEVSELEKSVAELRSAKATAASIPETLERTKANLAELPEDSYRRDSLKRDVEAYEKELKSAKDKAKRIEAKFAEREISDPHAEIASLKSQIESTQAAINDSKLSFERLLEKYQREYEQNVLNTKTMEDHRAQIAAVNSQLRERSAEELQAEKSRLIAESERKADETTAAAVADDIKKGRDPGEDGGQRVPDTVPRRTPGAGAMASKQAKGISGFEKNPAPGTEAFQLSERVKSVIDSLETNYTRYVAPGSVGTFYTGSKNVAVRSLNDLATVHHELSHLVDDRIGITSKYLAVTGRASNGLPKYDPQHAGIRKSLTQAYLRYYPGARKGDKLRIRVMEGYAVFQEKALTDPTVAKRDFPALWTEFVENGHDLQKRLNSDMRMIVDDWQGLSDMDKIGSVVTDKIRNDKADDFLTTSEKIEETVADAAIRFDKLDRMAGQQRTEKGIYNLLVGNDAVNTRIYRNIAEKRDGLWHFVEGKLQKVSDTNWAKLVEWLGKNEDKFSQFLIARDQHFEWLRLEELEAKLEDAIDAAWPFPINDDVSVIERLRQQRDDIKSYLDKNSEIFPRDVVDRAYADYASSFETEAAVFDELVAADLRFLRDTGVLSKEKYDEYSGRQGYAPMRRLIEDGLLGESSVPGAMRVGGVKVSKPSQLKGRKGGTHDVIHPILGAIANHREAMRKGYRQMTMNRLYDTLVQFPDLAQEVKIETVKAGNKVIRMVNGKDVTTDPNLIVRMRDGKPEAVAVSDEIRKPLEMIFEPARVGVLESASTTAARWFSKGTTSLYIPFAVTNFIRDQITAAIHTKTNYVPIIDQAKHLFPALLNRDSAEAQYAREYLAMGGAKLTRMNFTEMSGREMLDFLEKEETGLRKVVRWIDNGLDILAIPTNWSEIGTRMTEYVKSRKAGNDMFTALEDAGQLTAPFHHKGTMQKNEFGRGYVKSVPYLNAIIQGIAQFFRTVKTSPEWKMRYAAAVFGVAGLYLYVTALMLDESDDATRRAWIQMDTNTLSKFVFIPKWNGEFWKVPIPQEIGWLGALQAMIHNSARRGVEYSPKEYVDAMLSFLPDPFQANNPAKAMLAWIPQWIKPVMEVAFNKTTFPEIRDLESKYDQQFLPKDRYHKNTSEFAKWAANTELGKSAGISPVKIDKLLEGYFGRAIGYVTGKPSAYDPASPVVQKEYFTSGRILRQFFELSEKAEQEWNSIRAGKTEADRERLMELDARRGRVNQIKEMLKEYRGLEEDSQEAFSLRNDIWEEVTSLMKFEYSWITQEERSSFERKEEQQQWKDERKGIVSDYVEKFRSATDSMKATRLENELKKEIIGDVKKSDPRYPSLSSRASAAISEFRIARSGDDFIEKISKMQTNAEKVAAFQSFKAGMTNEEYAAKIRDYRVRRLISEDLAKLLLKNR